MHHGEGSLNLFLAIESGPGIDLLKMLSRTRHRIVAVATTPPRDGSAPPPLWAFARRLGLPTLPSATVRDPSLADFLRREGVDLLINSHSLAIVADSVLSAARIGAFNVHPGPLPRYAGLNSPSWAIFRGESTHGVTVHHMAPKIDAGPIAYQTVFPIDDDDTGLSVSARCAREGLALLKRLLNDAAKGSHAIPRLPQNLERREYFGAGVPCDGRLAWGWPARRLFNFIRAAYHHPFPSPWGCLHTTWRGRQLGVLQASLHGRPTHAAPGTVAMDAGRTRVACGDEWLLLHRIRFTDRFMEPSDLLCDGDPLGAEADVAPPHPSRPITLVS